MSKLASYALLIAVAWSVARSTVAAISSDAAMWEELELQVADRGLNPDEIVIPARLSDEMKRWVHSKISVGTPPDRAFREVLAALVDPEGLGLVYDPSYTGTAQEVWSSGKANCLGFTHLFVGLTREVGIATYYVKWGWVERYRKEGDLVLVSGHVSAGWGVGSAREVLEFGAVEGMDASRSRRISDINAVARHYANRSAELLRGGMNDEALAAAETAIVLDPDLVDAWVNLGVSRRRSGDQDGAEAAYRRATLVDPDHLPAYQNLSVLLRLRGAEDSAQTMLELLDRRDNRNPFTYLALGDESFESRSYEEAVRYYKRATKLGRDLAEPRAAMGLTAMKLGELSAARKWLRRAQAINPEESRTRELARLLSQTEDSSK
jgi:tetratricopeptide (TPR) repeat protein